MTVGELRALLIELGTCDVPDDAEVLVYEGSTSLGGIYAHAGRFEVRMLEHHENLGFFDQGDRSTRHGSVVPALVLFTT